MIDCEFQFVGIRHMDYNFEKRLNYMTRIINSDSEEAKHFQQKDDHYIPYAWHGLFHMIYVVAS